MKTIRKILLGKPTIALFLAFGVLLSLVGTTLGQPVITAQTQSCTNADGTTATLWVEATGTPPLAYQWQQLGDTWSGLAGSTDGTLPFSRVQTGHTGDYRIVITNVDGAITSDVAPLAVLNPPRITPTVSLQNWALELGANSSFEVTASGAEPLSFQWRLNGRDLPGETRPTLSLTNLQPEDGGDYTVVVTNEHGTATSEPARLWVVPPAADFIMGNFTNELGDRLPYFYLLPANYTAARSYPLVLNFHGYPGDETMITTPNGFGHFPRMKVFASYHQQETDPTIVLWPARRAGDAYGDWSSHYLQLTLDLLDQFQTEFSIDTNRVYVTGFSQGSPAAWDLIAMRPGGFAGAGLAAGGAGSAPPAAIKHLPFWVWCARTDGVVRNTVSLVRALREAGGNPIYTEFASGSLNPHLYGIGTGASNPAFVAWLLAQRRGVASTIEPLLSITTPTPATALVTSASNLDLSGSAAALGRAVTEVTWTNYANHATGVASGTNDWSVKNIPLVAGGTNVVAVVGATTSWAPAFGGNTTFNAALTVVQSAIRATLTLQGTEASLSWTGGTPPYRVQRAAWILGPWTDSQPDATPPVTLPLDGTAGFYRIIGQ
jgi:poly(3-hydroxybutyrate) depolymerase